MANNKNQHFVPRCHLKPFTLDGAGMAINVYNLDRRKGIRNAPVKSQCSADYFYGVDPKFEPILKLLEDAYAGTVRRIVAPKYLLTKHDETVLRHFCLLQWCRTEAAAKAFVTISSDLARSMSRDGDVDIAMTMKEAAVSGIMNFVGSKDEVGDLKVCLALNRTPLDFVTSDDPAILTNRWYIQTPDAQGVSFGIGSAGAVFYLPLTPRVCCIVYDGDVYSIMNSGGWRDVTRIGDVEAINEQQFLNCNANVYFREWDALPSVQAGHHGVHGRRLAFRHKLVFAVLDHEDGWGSRYRVVSAEEAVKHERSMIHMQFVRPPPSRWPSTIQWRSNRKVYSNGTGTNFVRKARIELGSPGSPPYKNVG